MASAEAVAEPPPEELAEAWAEALALLPAGRGEGLPSVGAAVEEESCSRRRDSVGHAAGGGEQRLACCRVCQSTSGQS